MVQQCNAVHHLTLVSSLRRNQSQLAPSAELVCKDCIVGKNVPVFRESVQAWQIGNVVEVNGDVHGLRFGDDDEENARISETPFRDYVTQHLASTAKREAPSFEAQQYSAFDSFFNIEVFDKQQQSDDTTLLMNMSILEDRDPLPIDTPLDPSSWPLERIVSTIVSPHRDQQHSTLDSVRCGQISPGLDAETPSRTPSGSPFRTPGHPNSRRSLSKRKRHDTPRKAIPRTWTAKEDKQLSELVENGGRPIKWSEIARSVYDRTGKQCRERYLNHLKPKIRFEEWSTQEDATLCDLYQSMGSKWALMTKILKGRTDNNIKNRFHHIRRRLEKDVSRIIKTRKIDEVASLIKIDLISLSPLRSEVNSEFAIRVQQILPYLAADSVKEAVNYQAFGPFSPVEDQNCERCKLKIPSVQCGQKVCQKTGWCESCTKIPPYVAGDMLRQTLNLRKERC